MARIDVDDVQGIVLRGYGHLPDLAFVLLSAGDRSGARAWLASLLPEVTSVSRATGSSAVNVAFTHSGLAALGLPREALAGFRREFREDALPDDHRDRILGDRGDSSPARWAWGGSHRDAIHVALMLYADGTEGALERACRDHAARFGAAGLREVARVDTRMLPGQKEHFGFRDGISQPCIRNDNPSHEQVEVLAPGPSQNTVQAGEFLYGYVNESGEVPEIGQVDRRLDPAGILLRDTSGRADFGRNGTYLVARQLAQNVQGFWRFVVTTSGDMREDPVRLAAKMVGRWPNGAPLVKAPTHPIDGIANDAYFGFQAEADVAGYKCPLGAHIRRANPRDALVEDPALSIQIVNRHRLIRRGRPYGPPLDSSLDPMRMAAALDPGPERGLLFLAFNVHVGRQFEFVQQNWLNNPKFSELHTDADPIAGAIHRDSTFTQQRETVRLRIRGLTSFVRVRGSGYFFMPGLKALRYLAEGVTGHATRASAS